MPACALPRCTSGPRRGSVACALGFQSRASWLFFRGSRSAEPSQAGQWKTPNCSFSLCCLWSAVAALSYLGSVSHRPLSSQALHFVTATVHQQSHAKLFPCTGHGRCFCVYVWVPCFLSSCSIGNRNKHAVQQSNWMLRRGQDDLNRHFLVIPRVKLWPFVIAGAFFSLWVGAVFTCRCSDAIVTTFPRPTLRAYTQRFVEPHPVIK